MRRRRLIAGAGLWYIVDYFATNEPLLEALIGGN